MEPTAQHAAPDLAETLNEACHCRTLDEAALRERLERDAGLGDAARQVLDARPHLFSATTVFVSQAVARTIADLQGEGNIGRDHILEAFQHGRYGDSDFYWHSP